jgi:hypothetical protein
MDSRLARLEEFGSQKERILMHLWKDTTGASRRLLVFTVDPDESAVQRSLMRMFLLNTIENLCQPDSRRLEAK